MKKEELLLVLQNPELSKILLDMLSKDTESTTSKQMPVLQNTLFGDQVNLPKAPEIVDLRDNGHRAASQFVDNHSFTVGQQITIWYGGHESGLRGAFTTRGLNPSINTLLKGKKYSVKITGTCPGTCPAKKKTA
jgi:hypothetical protein